MRLRELIRTVIDRVETVSGCPVIVSEDPSVKTLVASRIARGANRIHTISYNPTTVKEQDYLICYQCGFILRLFGIAESNRVDFTGTAKGQESGFGEIQNQPKRYGIIDLQSLSAFSGFADLRDFQSARREWVEQGLENGLAVRDECWSDLWNFKRIQLRVGPVSVLDTTAPLSLLTRF
jgi:hypothetical protein